MQDQGFDWEKSLKVCNKRAASMVSCHSGANTKTKKLPTKTRCLHIA